MPRSAEELLGVSLHAVVLDAPNTPLRVVNDHPAPVAGSGLVLDVTACGVCHSDLHVADGNFGTGDPIILGHEVTGVHHELGPVMLYAPWGCLNCLECSEHNEMICSNSTEAGLFTDGGYAQQMYVPDARYLAPLDGLDPYAAAPLACGGLTAYRAVLQGLDRLRSDAKALVLGAGGLGQFAIRYLRLLSDAHVTALDLSEPKIATALEIGAHEAVSELEEGARFDLIVDFIGAESTLRAAAGSIAKLGTISVVGLAGGTIPFGFGAVPLESRLVASVWGSRSQMDDMLDLVRREPSIIQPVEVLPLTDAQTAHDRLRAGDLRGRIVLDIANT